MQGSLPVAREAAAPAPVERRIDYIDGLRALAVLGVIVAHVASHRLHLAAPRFALEGAHGVDLFFVLSGFCLAYPTLTKLRRTGKTSFDAVSFGAKRFVRILPPFYIATLLLVIAFIAVPAVLHPGRATTWNPADILASLLFLDGNVHLINSSFWTLMVEFRWYFTFPFLLALWIAAPRGFLTLGTLIVIAYHFTRARGLDLGTLPGFMLGIVAADLQAGALSTGVWSMRFRKWAIPLALACTAIGVASEPFAMIPDNAYGADLHWAYQPTILGWQLAMFFLVVAAGEHGLLRRALSMRVLIATGVASYGIYLVHQPVVEVVEDAVHGPFGFVAALALAPLAGFAFWAVAERPFTTGPLRAPLVRWSTAQLARVFALLGVGRALSLVDRRPEDVVPAVAAAPASPVPLLVGGSS